VTQRSRLVAIPDNWRILPLKYAVQLSKSRADQRPDDLPYLGLEHIESWTGRILKDRNNTDLNLEDGISTVNLFEPEDVLFGKLRPYLAKACYPNYSGACTTEALVLQPKKELMSPRYLLFSLLLPEFINEVNTETFGSKMPRADWDTIGNLPIAIPPVDNQRSIVDFLNRETVRLDNLLASKQNLLNLLAEKRRTLIISAVTRGINPNEKLKNTGFSWLGEIPEHWEIERSKWLFKERDIRSEFGNEEMLTVSHLTGVTTRAEKNVNMFLAESQEGSKICEAGDLVINTLWAWMGAMGVSPQRGIVSPAYNVYEPGERLDKVYLDYLVRMPVFAQEAIRFSKGVWSSRLRLYPEGLYEIWFPVPPIGEQRAIAEFLDVETKKIDALQEATDRTIALLRERRTALIAAAVTGRIDIPEATV
jgi:type I restriction enzyme S subunit